MCLFLIIYFKIDLYLTVKTIFEKLKCGKDIIYQYSTRGRANKEAKIKGQKEENQIIKINPP